jgi:urease accessory protein
VDRAGTAVRPLTGAVDGRRAHEVGRRARLELTFAVRDDRTTLTEAYAEPPLRVGRVFEEGRGAHLILASSAPGIFAGDRFDQRIRVGAGAVVRLTSQSALQVHPSAMDAPAMIRSHFTIERDGDLSCTWDPIVPFTSASLDQEIRLDVAAGARLLWSDAMMSGREGRGERWQFAALEHELRLCVEGRPVYLERYRIGPDPAMAPLDHRWVAGDACYFGTILRVGWGDVAATAEAVHRALDRREHIAASADIVERDLLLVRIAASGGVPFRWAREQAMRAMTGSSVRA